MEAGARKARRAPAPDGLLEDTIRWPDNPEGEWYYLEIQEAANGHIYDRKEAGGVGIWTELTGNRDWTELERQY